MTVMEAAETLDLVARLVVATATMISLLAQASKALAKVKVLMVMMS